MRIGSAALVGAWIAAGPLAVTHSSSADAQAPVNGATRLMWDQEAAGVTTLQQLQFVLTVNGARVLLHGVRCVPRRAPPRLACAAQLPPLPAGATELRLIAIAAGLESEPSLPLHVGLGREPGVGTVMQAANGGRRAQALGCRLEGHDVCALEPIDHEPVDNPTLLAAIPDGRLLLVEATRRVRILGESIRPALELPQGAEIVGVTVDPQFSRTWSVFVGWTERRRDQRELHITRYREVAGTLGEGATILTGVPLHGEGPVPMAVGADGLVYAALPPMPSGYAPSGGGVVLRVTRDGRVPFEASQVSPVVSTGYSEPEDLAIDPVTGVVWLGGRYANTAQPPISALITSEDRWTPWPFTPRAAAARPTVAEERTTRTRSDDGGMMVVAGGQLYRGTTSGAGALLFEHVRFDTPIRIRDVARQPDDSWVLLVEWESGAIGLARLQVT